MTKKETIKNRRKVTFRDFLLFCSLLSGRAPKSLFRYFFATLIFPGLRALWDLLPLTTLQNEIAPKSFKPKTKHGRASPQKRPETSPKKFEPLFSCLNRRELEEVSQRG